MKGTFLLVHRGALGDFIMAWPAIIALRKHFPDSRFHLIGRPEYAKFARRKGIIDSFSPADSAPMTEFFEGIVIPPGFPENVTNAILWLEEPEKSGRLISAKFAARVLEIRPFADLKANVASHYYSLAEKFFGLPSGKLIRDFLPESPANWRKEYAAIHPGSGSRKKNLSAAFFRNLSAALENKTGLESVFIFGQVEVEAGLPAEFADFRRAICGSLDELEGVLSGAAIYIGNDSGATHFASFAGVPTIAIYKAGATFPEIWGTFGRNSVNIVADDENAAMENVLSTALKMLSFPLPGQWK